MYFNNQNINVTFLCVSVSVCNWHWKEAKSCIIFFIFFLNPHQNCHMMDLLFGDLSREDSLKVLKILLYLNWLRSKKFIKVRVTNFIIQKAILHMHINQYTLSMAAFAFIYITDKPGREMLEIFQAMSDSFFCCLKCLNAWNVFYSSYCPLLTPIVFSPCWGDICWDWSKINRKTISSISVTRRDNVDNSAGIMRLHCRVNESTNESINVRESWRKVLN